MGISQTVVTGFIIVVIVVILISCLDLVLPLYVEYRYHKICRQYALMMESENGLELEKESYLIEALSSLGIKDIDVQAPRAHTIKRHEMMSLVVEGTYESKMFKSLFQRKNVDIYLYFETSMYARKVFN